MRTVQPECTRGIDLRRSVSRSTGSSTVAARSAAGAMPSILTRAIGMSTVAAPSMTLPDAYCGSFASPGTASPFTSATSHDSRRSSPAPFLEYRRHTRSRRFLPAVPASTSTSTPAPSM